MSGDPDTHELARQVAVLEERMNTKQAEYESALDRLRSDMRADMSRLSEGMARRDTESAKRDKDNTRWQIGLWLAAIVVLGFLIRWPF